MCRFISFAFLVCVVSSGCMGLQSERRILFPRTEAAAPIRFASLDAPVRTAAVIRDSDDKNDDDWMMRQFDEHPWLWIACIGASLSAFGYIIHVGTKE